MGGDVFYDAGGGEWFVRVQVKSTMFLDRGGYTVTVRGWKGKYTGDPFDFVAAYLIPLDIWCILPVESFKMQGNVGLYPKLKKSKIWAVHGGLAFAAGWAPLGTVDRIEACAEVQRIAVSI